jgi:thiol-disulfide isomerase/thioredoxin
MKSIVIAFFIGIASFASAQIEFFHGTLDEALAKGAQEGKPVFVDVYAKWCGPCKQMAATAFVDNDVSVFYNSNYVSLKLDGETEHGRTVMNKYQITAYPTLLYFNKDGALVKKEVGGQSAGSLLKIGKLVQDPTNDPVKQVLSVYSKSKKNQDDLSKVIDVLSKEKSDSLTAYCKKYYERFPNLNLSKTTD